MGWGGSGWGGWLSLGLCEGRKVLTDLVEDGKGGCGHQYGDSCVHGWVGKVGEVWKLVGYGRKMMEDDGRGGERVCAGGEL